MSLTRLVYYSAVVGGWAAFFGWLIAEIFVLGGRGDRGLAALVVVGCLVGAAIGAGLNVVAGMTNARLLNLVMRVPTGLIGGGLGGAAGIFMGQLIYSVGMPRALGFMFLGIGVGIVEGLYERSPNKIRNGLIGGLIGGLVGGFLFDPISTLLASASGIASRATAFVILGVCIGALVGFVQVIMKEASLRVLDGYGVGREIILSDPVTVLGRGDHLRLPFMGVANADLESEHLKILRQPGGAFTLEDNHSKLGVSVRSPGSDSYEAVRQPRTLRDGDVIRLGSNLVRFSQRKRKAEDPLPLSQGAGGVATPSPATPGAPPPPPPPPTRRPAAAPTPGQAVSSTAPAAKPSPPSSPPAATQPAPPAAAPAPTRSGLGPPPPPPPPRKK
jgi:pSer/pThr/pTyr-binding forkhead associated (FHA) protein